MRLVQVPATWKPWLPLLAGISIVALLVGVGIGRILDAPATTPEDDGEQSVAPDGHVHGGGDDSETSTSDVSGVSLSQAGYSLRAESTDITASDEAQDWSFQIVDSDGEAVSDYSTVHGADMHLFAIRADLTGYQHRHPELDDGQWSTELVFDEPGPWRVIADFAVEDDSGQQPLTLGVDVTVDGQYEPEPLPEATAAAETGDFTVDVDFTPQVGVAAPALLRVTKDGEPVALQRYLDARGHLVALREGDSGFLHVHPDPELVDGALRFWVTVPSPGKYRAFLDFKVDGEVNTAAFTIDVS